MDHTVVTNTNTAYLITLEQECALKRIDGHSRIRTVHNIAARCAMKRFLDPQEAHSRIRIHNMDSRMRFASVFEANVNGTEANYDSESCVPLHNPLRPVGLTLVLVLKEPHSKMRRLSYMSDAGHASLS